MFEGDMTEGELEIGQVSSLLRDIEPAGDIVNRLVKECMELAGLDWATRWGL
jgi:enoyl-[acyl-carrier protein] reductase II